VTDDELVVLARGGDAEAFTQLVVRHEAAVYRAALAALRVPEDAEEAAQDAFVRAWTKLGSYRGTASFRTWLLTITWNGALTRRRRITVWLRNRAPLDAADLVATGGVPPDAQAQCRELRVHAASAIGALRPALRDALLLAASGDFGYAEIAAMLGVPLGTVKWRVSEARKQVRAALLARGFMDAR